MAVMQRLIVTLTFVIVASTGLSSIGHQEPSRLIRGVSDAKDFFLERHSATKPLQNRANHVEKRQGIRSSTGALLCSPTQVCVDGSCCGKSGSCGYGPEFCGAGNCTSQCEATAMCGIYSTGGNVKCGMNLCCSSGGWCGTSDTFCVGYNEFAKCQQGYGLCKVVTPTTCGTGSGTANGRTIGYYQASNVRNRVCNQIAPSQIKTDGYTHLYFAFASVDPTSYRVVPADSADVALYKEFTALKSSTLQTWIAIGGFDFSDSTAPTHTTWSKLSASAANRQAFIQSLIAFMDSYGFQGVDIDWEYPGDATRGGSPADTGNFVQLVKEMNTAFNGKYGISVALAPDYWYLRWFDAIAMEPYVSWFGFMAYDLHGSWDADVKTLGSMVRGQTDVREIYNDTLPLWFDGLPGSKINFGVAYYGRGYTLSDPSCNTLGCGFQGPSKPGACTNQAGVLSLVEIQALIKAQGIQPTLLSGPMMKQITWEDQWIGYDDDDTVALKKQFANNLCFGGTMAWSVDFHSGPGNNIAPPVSSDGSCGSSKSGKTCVGSSFGGCCSASGWCGNGDSFCGSGCQSGNCTVGAVTTDGTCGVGHWNSTCGGSHDGCCSAAGYCGTGDTYCGLDSQSAFHNSLRKGVQGVNMSEPWFKIDCGHGSLASDLNSPVDRWADALTGPAWADCLSYYQQYMQQNHNTRYQFSQIIADHIHATSNRLCLNVPDKNCDTTVPCDDQFGNAATGVSSPAGYMIINSFANLHNNIDNMDQAMQNALTDFQGTSSQVVKAFAQFGETTQLKITLDALNLIFSLVAAPTWNSWIKKISGEAYKDIENAAGTVKDSLAGLVAGGTSFIKDTLPTNSELNTAATFQKIATETVQAMRAANNHTATQLFSGADTTVLNGLMADGWASLTAGITESPINIERRVYQALVAIAIPMAWRATGHSAWPFIITSKGIDQKGTGCAGLNPDPYLKGKAAAASFACVNGQGYWLIMGNTQFCTGKDLRCEPPTLLNPVPGIGSLDGSEFGGLTVTDLVTSSLNAFNANGGKNGWKPIDVTQNAAVLDIAENGVRAAGVFNVPICSAAEARRNLLRQNGVGKGNWPC